MKQYPLYQLFWEYTLRCNMQCRHCGSDCRTTSVTPDMPLADFLPVLDEIRANQPSIPAYVHTLGGEPLVRSDIMECGRAITERGFRWGMVSNGQLIDGPTMRELSRNGLRSLAVDVDGLRDEHNWLRNSELAFDRVFNAIGHIRQTPNLLWDVITCVHPRNIDTLPELKRMLIEAGVKHWRAFTIVPMGRADRNAELQLSAEQFHQLMEFIVATRQEGKIDLSYACDSYLGRYEQQVRSHKFSCQSGITVASVWADGSISGCLSMRSNYHQGNIYRDSFWDVWTNRFEKYRNRLWMRTEQCAECEAWNQCLGNGLHLRRDDGSLMVCNYNRLKECGL